MEQTTGTILGPDGRPAATPVVILDHADARIFRAYKQVLRRLGLREALYCQTCWDQSLSDGCEASVTTAQIVIKCRCRLRFYQGATP